MALVLAACGASEPKEQSLTVATEAASPSATGPGASEAAPASGLADSTGAPPMSSATPTASKHRVTPKAKPARVTVTKTIRVSGTAATAKPGPKPTPAPALRYDVPTVMAAERAAIAQATTVRVVGTVVNGGKKFGVDLQVGTDGGGVLSYDQGTINVRRVGSDLYLAPDDAFFTAHKHPELAAAYRGTWMPIVPADPAYANIIPLTRIATWTKLIASAPAVKAAAGTAVDGVATVAVAGGAGATANTLYIAAAAPAFPLLTVSGTMAGQIRFSAWNAAVAPGQRPAALKDEPADAIVDVPSFAEDSATAFSVLWPA
jgi:hypothetical protein